MLHNYVCDLNTQRVRIGALVIVLVLFVVLNTNNLLYIKKCLNRISTPIHETTLTIALSIF